MSNTVSRLLPRPAMRFERVAIALITVRPRLREVTPEHVTRLMNSFETLGGQIQPIVISDDFVLIDGYHRLTAARECGWTHIDAGIASGLDTDRDRAIIEAEANIARRQMTPTEQTSLWFDVIEPRLSEEASARRALGRGAELSGDLPDSLDAHPETATQAKQYVGVTVKTMQKVRRIQQAAADETLPPIIRSSARAGLERMDQTGKIDAEFKRVDAQLRAHHTPTAPFADEERLVSRAVGIITRASQDFARIEAQSLVQALKADPTAAQDWSGVITAATSLLHLVEEAADAAEIRVTRK